MCLTNAHRKGFMFFSLFAISLCILHVLMILTATSKAMFDIKIENDREMVKDWNMPFLTEIMVIDQTEDCSDAFPGYQATEIFHAEWPGTLDVYVDQKKY